MVQVTVRSADEYNSLTTLLHEHRHLDNPSESSVDVLKRLISERNTLLCEFKEHQSQEWAQTLLKRLGNQKIMLDCGLKQKE